MRQMMDGWGILYSLLLRNHAGVQRAEAVHGESRPLPAGGSPDQTASGGEQQPGRHPAL